MGKGRFTAAKAIVFSALAGLALSACMGSAAPGPGINPTSEPAVMAQQDYGEATERTIEEQGVSIEDYLETPTAASTPLAAQIPDDDMSSSTRQLTYCRDNLAIFQGLYPSEFEIARQQYGDIPCLRGTAPPNSRVLDVPFYNQAGFMDLNSDKSPCDKGSACYYSPANNGCGPTSLYMALRFLMPDDGTDFYKLWDMLAAKAGEPGALAQEKGIYGSTYENMSWNEIKASIDQGHVIMMAIFRPMTVNSDGSASYTGNPPWVPYETERYCGPDRCFYGSHWVDIIGYSEGEDISSPEDDFLVFNDPHTGRIGDSEEQNLAALDYGEALIISRSTYEERICTTKNQMIELMPPK
jgi:hypothetical protein